MSTNEQLLSVRNEIDEIDRQLLPLFTKRMQCAEKVAQIKRSSNLAIFDETREKEILARTVNTAGEDMQGEVSLLMRAILALSRLRQRKLLFSGDAPLLPLPVKHKTGEVTCAFQGVSGAWSEQALLKLYPDAETVAVDYFEDVFKAVKEGRADYGIVPIENSQTGAIGETYDLLRAYGCFIVGRTTIDILQCLLAKTGVCLSDIRQVYSHPEGFKQCRRFLEKHSWDLDACRNTAVAAQLAAEAADGRTAAIGSRRAAELNGLEVLAPDIMDSNNNRTSFVVVAAAADYDENSNTVSVTFSTSHRSGALCEALLPLMSQNLNLQRIESRPAGVGNYRFFADIEGNIMDKNTVSALTQVSAACDYFEVLGCFKTN